jgi:hypothetical protein
MLPLPSIVEATAGNLQLPAEPGCGEAIGEIFNQLKPLSGSCSFAKCAAASLKKIFLPLQLSVFLSQPGQFISLVAGELALIRRTKITAVDLSLRNYW